MGPADAGGTSAGPPSGRHARLPESGIERAAMDLTHEMLARFARSGRIDHDLARRAGYSLSEASQLVAQAADQLAPAVRARTEDVETEG